MPEVIVDWIPVMVAAIGSVGGGYLGVKLAVARLETQMVQVLKEIESLRQSRHHHAGMIQEHEGRLSAIERQMQKK